MKNESIPLPLFWYFDPAVLEMERKMIFETAGVYVGAVPMVPAHGHYYALERFGNSHFLLNDQHHVRLFSNICPHRNMLLVAGSGHTARAVSCPMHKWAFDFNGTLINAPHYPEPPCVSLEESDVQVWNGLLFTGPRNVPADLKQLGAGRHLNVSDYTLHYYEREEQPVNWKIPIEVFLDNYHLPYVHPGLNLFTRPADWFNAGGYEDDWLVFQEIPANPHFRKNTGSPVYERWQNRILDLNGGSLPEYGVIVSLYFPNTILEWWPSMFIATTYQPVTPEKTLMTREYYFDRKTLDTDPDYAAWGRQAYDESQAQDDVLHEGIQQGRKHKYLRDGRGPGGYAAYQSPAEDCVKTFHERLIRGLSVDAMV